ncbi:MAG TPA: hypothetical protein VKN99_04445 [Polyangia bacterium]|nr:hypothetical protein [Polyangia bacterium]
MSRLGFVLLVLGVCVGAVGAARVEPGVDWWIVGAGATLLLAGAVAARVAARVEARRVKPGSADDPLAELTPLTQELAALASSGAQLELATLIGRLDSVLERIDRFAQARPLLLARLGSQRFAELLGQLATGERLLARAWSAAADHHLPECQAALAGGLARTQAAVQALSGALASGSR